MEQWEKVQWLKRWDKLMAEQEAEYNKLVEAIRSSKTFALGMR